MKKILLLLTIALCSCQISNEPSYWNLESFISGYIDYSEVNIRVDGHGEIIVEPVWKQICSYNTSDPTKLQLFHDLANRNGDVGYKRKVLRDMWRLKLANMMPVESLVKIELNVADGSDEPVNLNDRVQFAAVTPKNYIRSGYTEQYQLDPRCRYSTEVQFDRCYSSIVKMADKLTADDLELIGNGDEMDYVLFVLQFTEQPQEPLNLELVLTFGDSRVIRKTFKYTPNK